MAIELREEIGVSYKICSDIKESANSIDQLPYNTISNNSIMVQMESIHSVLTKNLNYYEPHCLQASVPKWTSPYERPVIMHHNDRNGIIIGRIKEAQYIEKNTRSNTPCLLFTCNIGNKEGIEGVENGTLTTVSIGVIVHDLRCSICGQNLVQKGECEHIKGQKYDDKLCFWIVKEMEPKEVSYVIVPSDKYAHNVKIYKPDVKNLNAVSESYEDNEVKKLSIKDLYYDQLSEQIIQKELDKIEEADDNSQKNQDEVKDIPKDEKQEEVPQNKSDVKTEDEIKAEAKDIPTDKSEEVPEVKKEEIPKEEEVKKEEPSDKNLDEIKKLEGKIDELLSEIISLKAKLKAEQGLRESAECKLLEIKKIQKLALAEQINELRKGLELEDEDVDTLIESSEEVLNGKIETLKEFSGKINKIIKKIPKLDSTSLVENKQDNTCVYDKKEEHQIDIEKVMIEKYKKLINRD